MKPLRAAVLLTVFLLVTLVLMPVQALNVALRLPFARTLPYAYHRFLCALFGIRIERHGVPLANGPLLIAANHSSWLDIIVMSALAPLSFVAKSEVATWPFFSLLAKLQRTVFVRRDRRSDAGRQRNAIAERLKNGERLVLFPEGTSSDGNRVLPFNSALFGAAEPSIAGAAVPVQPIAVTYARLLGLPIGRRQRHKFAWYGDMELVPHLWNALGEGPIDVVVYIHEPVTLEALGSRKALARHCERAVGQAVALSLAGRPDEAEAFGRPPAIAALQQPQAVPAESVPSASHP